MDFITLILRLTEKASEEKVCRADFLDQSYVTNVSDIMQQAACLVINPITVDSFASLKPVGRVSGLNLHNNPVSNQFKPTSS